MTVEQKAEAYDRAFEKAKIYYISCKERGNNCFVEDMEDIFPGLIENEDERIRKNCIHFLELQKAHHASTFEIDECITWLEKPVECGEEDERMRKDIIEYLKDDVESLPHRKENCNTEVERVLKYIAWLESFHSFV